MIVSAIEKRKGRKSAVFCDGQEVAQLDNELILLKSIKPGSNIPDEVFAQLVEESNDKRAREKAIWLISKRDYSGKELFDKLKKDTSEQSAWAAVQRMQELGLVDDVSYARRRAKDLVHLKGFSQRRVVFELTRRGIDKELAEQIAQELSPDPDVQIKQLIERRYRRYLNDEKGVRRTYHALVRMGYRYGDIKSALRDYIKDEVD